MVPRWRHQLALAPSALIPHRFRYPGLASFTGGASTLCKSGPAAANAAIRPEQDGPIPSAALRAARDLIEARKRLAGRSKQSPIILRNLNAAACAPKCRAAPYVAGHASIQSAAATFVRAKRKPCFRFAAVRDCKPEGGEAATARGPIKRHCHVNQTVVIENRPPNESRITLPLLHKSPARRS
jgi:hypothetical protein